MWTASGYDLFLHRTIILMCYIVHCCRVAGIITQIKACLENNLSHLPSSDIITLETQGFSQTDPKITKVKCCLYLHLPCKLYENTLLILPSGHIPKCRLLPCAAVMAARFTVEQVLKQISLNVQQDYSDFEEEVLKRRRPRRRSRTRRSRRNPSSCKTDCPVKKWENDMVLSSISQTGQDGRTKGHGDDPRTHNGCFFPCP